MIIFELTGSEKSRVYETLEISNGDRHYSFLESVINASVQIGKPFLSQEVIKALNFHAIACLHVNAGHYRPCEVQVGTYRPPQSYRVGALMDDFVNTVNRIWESTDAVTLGAFVLWKLNHIHPFINGNGRTARAACYFVICLKLGGLLPGSPILPQLLKRDRDSLVDCLRAADESLSGGDLSIGALHSLVVELLREQLGSVEVE